MGTGGGGGKLRGAVKGEGKREELRVKSDEWESRVKREELRVKSEELRVKSWESGRPPVASPTLHSSLFTLHS
jgi:hypothetical protein